MKARTDIYTGIQGTGGIGTNQWAKDPDGRQPGVRDQGFGHFANGNTAQASIHSGTGLVKPGGI